jgi:hypothetical protein
VDSLLVDAVDSLLVDAADDLSKPPEDHLAVETVDNLSRPLTIEAVDAELRLGRLDPSFS